MSATARHHQPATARQMPLPLREPPFDDERGDGHGRPVQSVATSTPVTQGSLALAHVLPCGTPAVPEPATALHLVDLGVVDLGAGGVAAPMPTQGRRASTRPAEPADARRWSARLAQGIAEALAGHRPVQQLVRWTDESVYEMLTHRLTGRVPAAGPRPRVRSIRDLPPPRWRRRSYRCRGHRRAMPRTRPAARGRSWTLAVHRAGHRLTLGPAQRLATVGGSGRRRGRACTSCLTRTDRACSCSRRRRRRLPEPDRRLPPSATHR